MSRWTDEEIRELVTLWPTNTAAQIAKRLHRQRAAIRRKAMLLGLLSADLPKHFLGQSAKAAAEAEADNQGSCTSTAVRG